MPDFGDGSARDQYGEVDQYAPSVANGQITPEAYAEYMRRRRRAAIIGTIGTLAGMSLAQPAANLLGIGAGSGAGAAAASVPGAVGAAEAPLGMGSVAGGVGVGSGTAVGAGSAAGVATLPAAATQGVGFSAAPAAVTGAGAAGRFLGLTGREWAELSPALAGTVAPAVMGHPNTSPTTATNDPSMQQLIATMQGRLNKSEPLYDSIMAMANGLLPTQYQKGGGGQ